MDNMGLSAAALILAAGKSGGSSGYEPDGSTIILDSDNKLALNYDTTTLMVDSSTNKIKVKSSTGLGIGWGGLQVNTDGTSITTNNLNQLKVGFDTTTESKTVTTQVFTSKTRTTISGSGTVVTLSNTIPLQSGTIYSIQIDWFDSSSSQISDSNIPFNASFSVGKSGQFTCYTPSKANMPVKSFVYWADYNSTGSPAIEFYFGDSGAAYEEVTQFRLTSISFSTTTTTTKLAASALPYGLPSVATDGTYVLKATVASGVITYSWVLES